MVEKIKELLTKNGFKFTEKNIPYGVHLILTNGTIVVIYEHKAKWFLQGVNIEKVSKILREALLQTTTVEFKQSRLPKIEQEYLIVSNKHKENGAVKFWRRNFSSYTFDIEEAGRYTIDQLLRNHYNYKVFGKQQFNICEEPNFLITEEDFKKNFEKRWYAR